jgi:transcriptional regulator with XRE-family HTH domain
VKLKKALAQRLKSLREKAGLSQQDVAVRGDLSLSLVAKLEQGKKADPRASTLLALAEALSVKPGALLDDLFPPLPPAPAAPGPSAVESAPAGTVAVAGNGEPVDEKKSKKKKKEGKKKKE